MAMNDKTSHSANSNTINKYKCYLCPDKYHDNELDTTNHLKSSHIKKDGDVLHCTRIQNSETFCSVEFKSFKALRKHLKENRCKLLSNDVTRNVIQSKDDENTSERWDCLIGDLRDLKVDEYLSTEDNVKVSLAAHIEKFVHKLIDSHLPHDVVNEVLQFSKGLIFKTTAMNKEAMVNVKTSDNANLVLDSTEQFVTSQLNHFNTRYKRTKFYENSPHFVAPKTIFLNGGENFQYVSILETLKRLFADENFKHVYFNYNGNHQCKKGVYERYCCGQNYKDNEFFQSSKNRIQIQIYYDDVQLTSPLKTTKHKVNAIYFIIRNLPPNFVSKLENIYLISLCDSELTNKYGINSILKPLVQDLKILETEGISVVYKDRKKSLEGTLVQSSFDNLGGNELFGYVKCFNANYYCRICFSTKKMCKETAMEVATNLRSIQHYMDQVKKIRSSPTELKSKDTFGIKQYSLLNELGFYNTIKNRSQDIMHDLYEGVMQLVLKMFFAHLIEHDIITEKEIEQKINSFEYGLLDRRNAPKNFFFKKPNLNQNASQMHCLMRNFPFIFVYLLHQIDQVKKSVVHKAWPAIEYVLKINQIVSSKVIKEMDIINLEEFTKEFLTFVKKKFRFELTPKFHFLTHYSNTIRAMGPLIDLQMMRGDAKHQPLTQYAKRTRNYINICKSLSEKHQEVLAAKWTKCTYVDQIEMSKKFFKVLEKKDTLINVLKDYSHLIFNNFKKDINCVILINFVIINTFTYRKDFFIVFSDEIYQINAVLKHNDSFVFLVTKFNAVKFYKFANCFQIQKSDETTLIKFDSLVCKRTYEAKMLNNDIQIIADNLDMVPIYKKCIT